MADERMTSEQFRRSGLQMRGGSKGRTDYKAELVRQMRDADLPEPRAEYVFHESRKWRFDFAFPELKVAVEYDGGVFDGLPSHSSVSGILRDIEKINEAQLSGWTVIRCTAQTVSGGVALRYIKRAISKAKSDILPGEHGKLAHVKRKLQGLIESIDK
jgi:very-short-patch-repair endonuclease